MKIYRNPILYPHQSQSIDSSSLIISPELTLARLQLPLRDFQNYCAFPDSQCFKQSHPVTVTRSTPRILFDTWYQQGSARQLLPAVPSRINFAEDIMTSWSDYNVTRAADASLLEDSSSLLSNRKRKRGRGYSILYAGDYSLKLFVFLLSTFFYAFLSIHVQFLQVIYDIYFFLCTQYWMPGCLPPALKIRAN